MATIPVQIVNAFVDGGRGGNPAGVVLDAERFSREAKQRIAARAGLSETAFVSPSSVAAFKLEFFTPTKQIPHCGHATIATFSYLAQLGKVGAGRSSKETIDGTRAIFMRGDMAFMEQTAPRYTPLARTPVDPAAVLASLHLTADDLLPGQEMTVVNTAVNCLVIPLRDEATLLRIDPDFPAITEVSRVLDLVEYYVFSTQTRVAGRDAGTRMFAPYYGIPEESATGMAAGPLACFLYDYLDVKKPKLIIEQGHLMTPPSPSELTAELTVEDGQIRGVLVGGRAMVAKTIEVEVE